LDGAPSLLSAFFVFAPEAAPKAIPNTMPIDPPSEMPTGRAVSEFVAAPLEEKGGSDFSRLSGVGLKSHLQIGWISPDAIPLAVVEPNEIWVVLGGN